MYVMQLNCMKANLSKLISSHIVHNVDLISDGGGDDELIITHQMISMIVIVTKNLIQTSI